MKEVMKKKFCIDCKKEISPLAKRCRKCRTTHLWKEGEWSNRDLSGNKNGMFGIIRCASNNPNFKDGRSLLHKCLDCNNLVPGYYKRCHSCSKKGRNNPAYKNGLTLEIYPSEFNDRLKEQIRQRDGYTCQNCGIIKKEHLIVFGRTLEVHHIDYNKHNCAKNNLITLCGSCNTRANFNRHYWERKFKQMM